VTTKILFLFLICAYLVIILPFTAYLGKRPVVNKVGYIPEAEILNITAGDQRYLISEVAVFKVMLYFGGMVSNKLKHPPEYANMARMLSNAVKLDPYNMDAYYLSQAAFVWDVKDSARDINRLLIYGMRYRTWDYSLPFFAGFNAAYFLHDYRSAADFMKRAAELSGDPLSANLSARYFHEAGRTELGILFISSMEQGAKDEKVKKAFRIRKEALLGAQSIAEAVARYKEMLKINPASIEELVNKGFIKIVPKDPYGGQYYLTDKGKVESTSKFAFGGQNR
jgi:tetratricopeptide (TPR) repeat protein